MLPKTRDAIESSLRRTCLVQLDASRAVVHRTSGVGDSRALFRSGRNSTGRGAGQVRDSLDAV